MNLHGQVEGFIANWAPKNRLKAQFVAELQRLLEAYGRAALRHKSLPDVAGGGE